MSQSGWLQISPRLGPVECGRVCIPNSAFYCPGGKTVIRNQKGEIESILIFSKLGE